MINLSRRDILRSAGGLLLGFAFPTSPEFLEYNPAGSSDRDADGEWLGAYVCIDPHGMVTLRVPASEMGQGVHTSLPMILAEELDLDIRAVRVEMAPNSTAYAHPSEVGKTQLTAGSGSVRGWWGPMAIAGATARAMLIEAAARRWAVPAASCTTANGKVSCGAQTATYGDLAVEAAGLSVPTAKPKPRESWKLIGTEPQRLDIPSKTNGTAVFGIDVKVPDAVQATVLHSPVFGARLVSVDDTEARKLPGVIDVLHFKGSAQGHTTDFVAVVADTFWHARVAIVSVVAKWEGGRPDLDDKTISEELLAGLDQRGQTCKKVGAPARAIDNGVTYEVPYLHHATMEPLTCTAHVHDHGVELWAPTQAQSFTERAVAAVLGVAHDKVLLHTTFLGGGFGRKSEVDFVVEAAQIAQAVGKPVKVTWTREEDFAHGFYRPAFAARLTGEMDAAGKITELATRLSGPNILTRFLPFFLDGLPFGFFVGENFFDLPYAVPNQRLEYNLLDLPIPTGFWRSVSASHNGFFRECFLDELAHKAGVDPVQFRLNHLADSPRHYNAVKKAAEMADWGHREGRFLGIAIVESFGSIVAEVAQIRIEDHLSGSVVDGITVHVEKVWVAFDCGRCIHRGIIKAQAEGSVGMGLSVAFGERMSIVGGASVTPNFYAYPVLKLGQMPEVEVEVLEGAPDDPGGVGEPALPPIAPAVCNAIFAALGEPIRRLPLAGQTTRRGTIFV